MQIVFHTHHAKVSDHMRRRAEHALRKVARRSHRPVDAAIRFQQDGSLRRVELTLHTAGGRRYVARSEDRFFGIALATAARRLAMQVDHTKRTPKARAKQRARAGAARAGRAGEAGGVEGAA